MIPEYLAAIDIGTNSFHLIVVKTDSSGNFEIADREKEVVRLGEGNPGDIKMIKPPSIKRAVYSLKRFKGIADSYGAVIRACATSAVREALNKVEFIGKIYEETGLEIEVISGYEEARLINLGIMKFSGFGDKRTLSIDIGGGSTEIILSEKGKIITSMSLKLGAVRLTQKFFPDFVLDNERVEKCRKWIEGEIYRPVMEIKKHGFQICAGSAGTITAVQQLISAARELDDENGAGSDEPVIKGEEILRTEFDILRNKTFGERKELPGMEIKRADIIPAGILILSTLTRSLGIEEMHVSEFALREGIILDTISKYLPADRNESLNLREDSIRQLSESYNYDREHCAHVSSLALKIFDETTELHKLGTNCREYLYAATMLHDIGYHISHNQHHRHSNYIIRNSEILGYNETEIQIIANVARYHRKSHPKSSHKDYIALSEDNRVIVNKLSALLRIADSFDRTHSNKIPNIMVKITADLVIFSFEYEGSFPEIELWNFQRRKELFEEVFEVKTEAVPIMR